MLRKSKKSPPREGEQICMGCGGPLDKVSHHTMHHADKLYTFHRCECCGKEWTTIKPTFHPADPVSTDEVLDVHEFLKQFDQPLKELLAEQD